MHLFLNSRTKSLPSECNFVVVDTEFDNFLGVSDQFSKSGNYIFLYKANVGDKDEVEIFFTQRLFRKVLFFQQTYLTLNYLYL